MQVLGILAMPSSRLLVGLLALLTTFGSNAQSFNLAYPAKPITMVVPFPPGGPTDASARLFAKAMSEDLAQAVVIENRAGAAGTVGSAHVARSTPDGYTLLWGGTSTLAVAPRLYSSLKYEAKSFVPIGMALRGPLMLAGHPSLPAQNLSQLMLLAKKRTVSIGSAGTGSLGHLAAEYLREAASLNLMHVPYRGGGPAITDAIGGQVELVFDTASALAPHVKAGKLRAYAVTGEKPFFPLPEVPLLSSVVSGYEVYSWFGPVAPAGTSPAVIQRLITAMTKAASSPSVQRELLAMGVEPGVPTARQFSEVIEKDAIKWTGIIQRADVKADD